MSAFRARLQGTTEPDRQASDKPQGGDRGPRRGEPKLEMDYGDLKVTYGLTQASCCPNEAWHSQYSLFRHLCTS